MLQTKINQPNAALLRRFLLLPTTLLLAACNQQTNSPQQPADCDGVQTPIHAIQGNTAQSSLLQQTLNTTGVVTYVQVDGFYLQAITPDDDLTTSDALWINNNEPPPLGAIVSVIGEVVEQQAKQESSSQTLTALANTQWASCEQEPAALPQQQVQVFEDVEALEHMRLKLQGTWQLADLYRWKDQQVRIASERLYIPTQVVSPGVAARQLKARNESHSVWVDWSNATSGLTTQLRAGDHLQTVTGLFDLSTTPAMVNLEAAPSVMHAAKVPSAPKRDAEQHLRVVSMNVENLFNGDGQSGDFPTPRGAETPEAYQQQLSRLVRAIDALKPDVLGLMELENDGYEPTSVIAQLTTALAALPDQQWAFVNAPDARLGDDVIAVGLLYRSDRVKTIGEAVTLSTAPFNSLSRTPLAQQFATVDSAFSLLTAVNHFKSKGSCPEDGVNSDQDDGQGCWNEARERSALLLSSWVKQLQDERNETNALIMGDLNSYRMEDPIRVLVRNNWIDVAGQFLDPPLYSYRYRGEIGTLDYAFASPDLMRQVDDADIWHINSDAARGQESSDTGIARFSDHDPVVVDINLH